MTRYVAVRSRKKKSFKILKVEVPDDAIKVKIDPLGTSGYRCELSNIMPFPDLDGKNVIIRTDLESAKEIVVPIKVVQ